MSTPITWRTIIGPSLADAARPMELARIGLNDAFGAFGNVVHGAEVAGINNTAALDEAAKQDYLGQLAAAKTPEELAALQASGKLDVLRRGLTSASQAAVRGADEARATALRQQLQANQTFGDQQRDRTELGDKQTVLATAARGNIEGAKALADMAGVTDKAPLYSAIEAARLKQVEVTRGDKKYVDDQHALTNTLAQSDATLAENKRVLDAAAADRALEKRLADATAARQAGSAPVRAKLEELAVKDPTIPRNTDGSVAIDRLTTAQRTFLNGQLGLAGMGSLDAVGNDTKAAADFREQLRKDGATPTQLAKLDPLIATGLSTAPTTPIGQDAAAAQRTMRALQVEEGAVRDQHGSLTYTGQKGDLMKVGTEIIDGIATGSGKERYTRALAKWLDKGGIPVGDKGERVLPSESQLRLLLGKVRTGWFYNAQSDVSDLLDDWAKSDEAQQGAQQVLRVRDRNRILGIDPLGKQ